MVAIPNNVFVILPPGPWMQRKVGIYKAPAMCQALLTAERKASYVQPLMSWLAVQQLWSWAGSGFVGPETYTVFGGARGSLRKII